MTDSIHIPKTKRGGTFTAAENVKLHANDFTIEEKISSLTPTQKDQVEWYRKTVLSHIDTPMTGTQEADDNKRQTDSSWEKHFSTSRHHFPLKNYIIHAFPIMKQYLAAEKTNEISILECGCGTGSTLIPLLLQYPETKAQLVGFDISASAIQHFSENPDAARFLASENLHLFQHDITKSTHVVADYHESKKRKCEAEREDLLHVIGRNVPSMEGKQYDAVLLIFVLSAIPTVDAMIESLKQLSSILKPEGVLLIRDYAFPDHNFFRFLEKKGADSKLFFLKGDGTTQFFFDKEILCKLADKAGMEELPDHAVAYHCNRIENRKNGKRMDKIFINGVFRKKK